MGLTYGMEQKKVEQKTKLICKLDPRTKLAWYALMIYFTLSFQTAVPLGLILLVAIITSLILTGSLKQYKVLPILMVLLGLQILIVQLLFCREGVLIYQWGILRIYSEAIPLAITGILKALLIVFTSMQFFTSASPQEFTLMLIKFKIPYRFAMLVGLSVRFLPIMKAEYGSILDSQRTRGLKMESVWDNLKSIIPTFLPLLYRAVRRSTEMALAMELRGYGRSKTRIFSSNLEIKPYDIALIAAMFLVIIISLTRWVLPLI
jgi:energy-coupling factor transport system permease protein